MLYVLLAMRVNSHTHVFQDRICLQNSLWMEHLTVTLRLASLMLFTMIFMHIHVIYASSYKL